MKRSEAARYARWSAALAIFLATVTVAVYVRHGAIARILKRTAPAAPAENVERQSAGLTFSKVEGDRKIFTVEASKSTEFRNQDASLLEEVKITIFGKQGDRHDVIRTHSCQYAKSQGSISCSGQVQIDLQTAANAELATKNPSAMASSDGHVETRNVTFEQASGTARTKERVTFTFPSATGQANGVEYNSQAGTMKLLRDVQMSLVQSGGPKGTNGKPVHITGSSLDFDRNTRVVQLVGPAHAQTDTAQLDAGEITLHLDEDFRAQELIAATGTQGRNPQASSSASASLIRVNANVLTAWFHPDGWLKKLDAHGNVVGSRKASAEDDTFAAKNVSVEMWPEITQPKQIDLDGSAVIKTAPKNGQWRVLETEKARLVFTPGDDTHPSQPKRAETFAAGNLQWIGEPLEGKTVATHTRLSADKLLLDFADGNANKMAATGNVRTERSLSGSPPQTATANRGIAQLQANGGWSQIELHDNVKFKEGERSGQADNALSVRDTQATTLTGHAVIRDATTETHAATIDFDQMTGDVHAKGNVRSTTYSAKGTTPQFAAVPATVASEKMDANSKTGRALYSGHARLWQGDSVMESDSIELLQKTRQLQANGNVRAVFPQQPGQLEKTAPATTKPAPKKSNLWHVASKKLTYEDLEDRAHLEGNVIVQSESQRMRSDVLDLYFTHAAMSVNPLVTPPAGPPQTAADSSTKNRPGARQISRAVGTGGVIVVEEARKATAERAEYTASDGKFVMSGGNPTLYDGTEGTTKGRQLTFFLADDTIIVDSEKGSRTLTKHRVEK